MESVHVHVSGSCTTTIPGSSTGVVSRTHASSVANSGDGLDSGTLALYHCVLQLRALRNEWLYDWRGLEFQQVVPRLATHLSHLLYLSWKSLNGKAMCIYVLLRAEQGFNDQFLFFLNYKASRSTGLMGNQSSCI